MSKKIFFRILFILVLSYIILYSVLASNTSDSTNLYCGKGIPDNNTIYRNSYFDCSTKIGVNFKALEGASVEIKGDLKLDSNIRIDGDLIVHGNLTVKTTLNIGGNLIVTGNITGENASIIVKGYINSKNIDIGKNVDTQALVSTGYVSLGNDSIITKGIITNGYLKTGDNLNLNGISKIKGDFTTGNNFKGSGIIYVYGDFTGIKNYNFDGEKLKVTNDFRIGTNGTNKGRIYLFGKKVKSSDYIEKNTSFDYLIGEIDPLLKITLNSKEFILIKNRTVLSDRNIYYYKIDAITLNNEIKNLKNYNTNGKNNTQINNKINELNKLKTKIINEYISLFDYLDDYIENDSFDINKYNYIKEYRLNDIEIFLNNLYGENNSIKINKITKKAESNTVIVKKGVEYDNREVKYDNRDNEISDNETWNDSNRENEIYKIIGNENWNDNNRDNETGSYDTREDKIYKIIDDETGNDNNRENETRNYNNRDNETGNYNTREDEIRDNETWNDNNRENETGNYNTREDEIRDNETWNDNNRENEKIKDRTQLLILREQLINKLSESMMNKLDKVINNIENSDAKYSYPRIIERIDQMIEDNEYKTTIEKEILKGIKSYLERDLEERDLIGKVFLVY